MVVLDRASRTTTTMVAGAVYVPALDEMFAAALGAGATSQRSSDHGQRRGRPRRWRWSAPGSATTPDSAAPRPSAWRGMIGEVRDIRRFGAAAVDLCFVAAGRLDVYFEQYPQRRGTPPPAS